MPAVRKRRLWVLGFTAILLALAATLVLYALRQNISLFYTPTQVMMGEAPQNRPIRIGGMVVKESLIRVEKGLLVKFKLTDMQNTIEVTYQGILPDLFREGQGIVAQGKIIQNQFIASQVLAKHDENYMPPEVKAVLSPQRVKM